MSVSLTLLHSTRGMPKSFEEYFIKLTSTGNYATNGDTVDFTTIGLIKASRLPIVVTLDNVPGGYSAEWIPGTTLANGKVKFYSSQGTELAAGAYPASLTGNQGIILYTAFAKNV